MTKVFIDGSAGTTGLRIFDRLSSFEDVELITLSEELRKDTDARAEALNQADFAFLCLPDDAAREAVSMVFSDTRILDTSTAHRTNPNWAYGFPELSDDHRTKIATGSRVAVPGCHASGFISLIYPLVSAGVLPKDAMLSVFSLTGYSGGGKKMIAAYGNCERDDLYEAPRQYALSQTHKHLPEMCSITGIQKPPVFCPVVGDFYSGMEVTIPLFCDQIKANINDIKDIYASHYKSGLVKFVNEADPDGFASAGALSMRDDMQVGVFGNDERMILVARYDNLGKGASGAALQCFNIMRGVDEKTGLNIGD